jgi:hypothetical protein
MQSQGVSAFCTTVLGSVGVASSTSSERSPRSLVTLTMLKSLSILLFFCLLDLFPGSFESGSITVDFDRVSATTGDGYISFNFDWHLNSEEPPAWYNSSVLVINLTNPKLIYLASQLSPGHLRVGGSEEDVVS